MGHPGNPAVRLIFEACKAVVLEFGAECKEQFVFYQGKFILNEGIEEPKRLVARQKKEQLKIVHFVFHEANSKSPDYLMMCSGLKTMLHVKIICI